MTSLAEALDTLLRLKPPVSWERRGAPRLSSPRFSIERLYRAARRKVGGPLADAAARALLAHVAPGSRVILTTGLVTPHIPCGETDGPSGTLALARALILGLKATAMVLTERQVIPVLEEGAAVLAAVERDRTAWQRRLKIRPFPSDPHDAGVASRRLMSGDPPVALISVEKLGPNGHGVVHTMRGEDVTRHQARTDILFSLAARRRILTVGIGDRGNEVGMGGLLARPAPCACPCRGSIACTVDARYPVAAFTSNWGAYALTAALAGHLGRAGLLPRPQSEARMLRRMVRAGAMDGATRQRVPTVDGTGLAVQIAFLGMLHALLATVPRP
jgi:hypothetical protein